MVKHRQLKLDDEGVAVHNTGGSEYINTDEEDNVGNAQISGKHKKRGGKRSEERKVVSQ